MTHEEQSYDLDITNGNGNITFSSPDLVLPPSGGDNEFTIDQPFSLTAGSLTLCFPACDQARDIAFRTLLGDTRGERGGSMTLRYVTAALSDRLRAAS